MKRLKQELADLKEQLAETTHEEQKRSRGIYIDIGDRVQDYVEEAMRGVAEGIHGELERSIFIGPGGVRIFRRSDQPAEDIDDIDFVKASHIMSALGQEHRLRILKELMSGGKYINELEEKLSGITASTLSSHLDILENAGLVVQEKARGRYLITIPGRTVFQMVKRTTRFATMKDDQSC